MSDHLKSQALRPGRDRQRGGANAAEKRGEGRGEVLWVCGFVAWSLEGTDGGGPLSRLRPGELCCWAVLFEEGPRHPGGGSPPPGGSLGPPTRPPCAHRTRVEVSQRRRPQGKGQMGPKEGRPERGTSAGRRVFKSRVAAKTQDARLTFDFRVHNATLFSSRVSPISH